MRDLLARLRPRRDPAPDPAQVIPLDYRVNSVPRWGFGKPPHPELYERIARGRERYAATLRSFLRFTAEYRRIPVRAQEGTTDPAWINGMLPGLDIAALYGTLATQAPARYMEIGSGWSTRVARRAIRDHGLRTRITSIDPEPRAFVDAICDEVVRRPVEDTDLGTFRALARGDVLFIDGSHRVFMNSDAVVLFLEVIPRLPAGVLVQVHDVRLPYDYYPEWADRFYSEQYLLAASLLGGDRYEVCLPNAFISADPELSRILDPVWADPAFAEVERHGDSFWFETT